MAAFLVYSLSTGAIDRTGSVPGGDELIQAQPDEAAMLNPTGVTGVTHWVSLGPPPVLMAKDAMLASIDKTYIAANLTQVATISGVPQGAEFYVDSVDKGRVDDGVVTFSAAAVGSHVLLLTHYRYLDQSFTVDVGLAKLAVATETEYAVNLRSPLPVAAEAETAIVANQLRTVQLTVASETETGVAAVLTRNVNLDVAAEAEQAVDASAPMPVAIEAETAIDAVLSNVVQLTEAIETETAFDAAA